MSDDKMAAELLRLAEEFGYLGKIHDFPPASGGRTTCRRCGWTVTPFTLHGAPPVCPADPDYDEAWRP